MIVKNEAQNLIPCIQPLHPVLDEIVVVDTGSTDNTKEIAQSLGAKVFNFPWRDDFSAVRNESIRHATGDHILWLDADDRVDASEVEKIGLLKKGFHRRKERAHYLTINSQSPIDGETHFLQLRIFPRLNGVRFEGRVHEQIIRTLKREGIEAVETDIVIRHTGYHFSEAVIQKSLRNLRIIEEELKTDPENPLLHYHAARTLSVINRQSEAIVHMKKVIGNFLVKEKEKQFYLDASLLLGQFYAELRQYQEAFSLYGQLAKEFMDNGLIYFHLGEILYLMEDYNGALVELNRSLRRPVQVGLLALNLGLIQRYRYYLLWQCYSRMGNEPMAGEMFLKSLSLPQGHYKDLDRLGLLCLKKGDFKEAAQYFEKAIQKGGESDKTYSNLGLAYRKLGRLKEAEKGLKKALKINPQRIEALVGLGYLYQEKNEYPEAIHYFSDALILDPLLKDVRLALSDIYFRLYDLENLVGQCDALLKELRLPNDITLDGFEDVGRLYEKIGETLSHEGLKALSFMALQTSFLICPSTELMEKIVVTAKESNVLKHAMEKIQEAIAFHRAVQGAPEGQKNL